MTEDDLRELRRQDIGMLLAKELGNAAPGLKEILLDERDQYLADRMRKAATANEESAMEAVRHIPEAQAWDDIVVRYRANLAMRGGEASTLRLVLTNIDLARAAQLLMGGDETAAIHCGVAALHAKNGVMTPDLFVVDTSAELITGTGSVNFADEKYDVHLKASSKTPSILALKGPIGRNMKSLSAYDRASARIPGRLGSPAPTA